MLQKFFPCPCCEYLTISEEPPGTFEICDVCGWEDDNVQFNDPEFIGGANSISLKKAKENFGAFGACIQEKRKSTRPPQPNEFNMQKKSD